MKERRPSMWAVIALMIAAVFLNSKVSQAQDSAFSTSAHSPQGPIGMCQEA